MTIHDYFPFWLVIWYQMVWIFFHFKLGTFEDYLIFIHWTLIIKQFSDCGVINYLMKHLNALSHNYQLSLHTYIEHITVNAHSFTSFHAFLSKGCPKIMFTRLNIIMGIVQKVHEWSSCPFAKMCPPWENHFGKIPVWPPIYFLNYAYFDI